LGDNLEISDFPISIKPDLSTFFITDLLVNIIIIYFQKHYNGVSMFLVFYWPQNFMQIFACPRICVRMFDDKYITEGDNPTIGLILCAKKNETIARYSFLNDSQQLFASKYMLYLPTEEELVQELDRERKVIETQKD
jgi:hypothetical protein